MNLESNILSLEYLEEEIEMMDLNVEEVHCYYANGIVTHNCGQELKILANLAGQQNWIDTFKNGGDLHKNMAIEMFGLENYNNEKRKVAKTLNFGLN